MSARGCLWATAILSLLAALLLAWLYLAGCGYFMLNKAWPRQIDLQTWLTYWQAYRHDPGQRQRLLLAAALPALLLLGVTLAVLTSLLRRQRPLHGDARWANEQEIRDAGLL